MVGIQDVLRDLPVRNEVAAFVGDQRPLPHAPEWNVSPAMVRDVLHDKRSRRASHPQRPYTEAVIRLFARPVLLVRNNRVQLPRSKEIRDRILAARTRLEADIPSVGRIEFVGNPQQSWGGTGWMISDKVIVTNRHVAELIGRQQRRGFVFKINAVSGEPMQARIDFREEYKQGSRPALEVEVSKIRFIEEHRRGLPDVAFLELAAADGLPLPIALSDSDPVDDADIAVIGYPARDPRGTPDETAAHKIFGDIYGVKRVAPGKVIAADAGPWFFTHDATTLGGNSGSVVIDLNTGAAVGLHFLGELEKANFAVNASRLANYLSKLRLRSTILTPASSRVDPVQPQAVEEATPESYDDRQGFDPAFLGRRARVELPRKTTRTVDMLKFGPSRRQSELKYTHFSLAMSASRRLCLWSAVNIDGKTCRKASRTSWRLDPRIPRDAQRTGDEPGQDVYGNEPHFARGHMTRREDPIWGDEQTALAGNSDSMHLTNVVPQMQPFNAGIWNNLEDYALENARRDQMRISVITGPFLSKDDPTRYGVPIPIEFWKVIAFIHDDTHKLTATGYTMSQESFLEPEEFVYGQYQTYQVPIRSIEKRTGLSFGLLHDKDPVRKQATEEAPIAALTSFNDIVF
jgi:endonuclease G